MDLTKERLELRRKLEGYVVETPPVKRVQKCVSKLIIPAQFLSATNKMELQTKTFSKSTGNLTELAPKKMSSPSFKNSTIDNKKEIEIESVVRRDKKIERKLSSKSIDVSFGALEPIKFENNAPVIVGGTRKDNGQDFSSVFNYVRTPKTPKTPKNEDSSVLHFNFCTKETIKAETCQNVSKIPTLTKSENCVPKEYTKEDLPNLVKSEIWAPKETVKTVKEEIKNIEICPEVPKSPALVKSDSWTPKETVKTVKNEVKNTETCQDLPKSPALIKSEIWAPKETVKTIKEDVKNIENHQDVPKSPALSEIWAPKEPVKTVKEEVKNVEICQTSASEKTENCAPKEEYEEYENIDVIRRYQECVSYIKCGLINKIPKPSVRNSLL